MPTEPARIAATAPALSAVPAPPRRPRRRRAPGRASGTGAGGRFGAVFEQESHQGQRQQHPGAAAQRLARAEDHLARGAAAEAERRGDLLVAEAFELAHHDRRPLPLRQRLQPLDQFPQLLALLRLGGGAAAGGDRLLEDLGGRRAVAEVVEGGVADDPVEPGPQLDLVLSSRRIASSAFENASWVTSSEREPTIEAA